jgi:Mn-dependent DtxR family transcriptional regulator
MSTKENAGFESSEQLRDQIESYLLTSLSSERGYYKSKEIANSINAKTKQVAAVITDLNNKSQQLRVEKWAYTKSTTWLVERTNR